MVMGLLAILSLVNPARPGPGGDPAMAGFGTAVAVAGDAVYVGETAPGSTAGVVHIYRRTAAGIWHETGSVASPDTTANDGFGSQLATDGSTLLVTRMTARDSLRGQVLAYRRNGTSWATAGTLAAAAPAPMAQFGAALALSGDLALVGAPGEGGGAVHLFRRGSDGSWHDTGTLDPGVTLQTGDLFGASLLLAGDQLAVGAPGRTGTGVVFFFHRDASGAWSAAGTVAGRRTPANGMFGAAMLLAHDTLYVGAPQANASTGVVTQFVWDAKSTSWAERATLSPFETGLNRFGATLAMVQGELWIGAPYSGRARGVIYRVRNDANGFTSMVKLTADSLNGPARFGMAIAQGTNFVAVGIPGDAGEGTVAFLSRNAAGAWTVRGRVFVPRKEYAAVTGGEVRCGSSGKVTDFTCSNTGLLAFLPISAIGGGRGVDLNDNWGWTDPASGREYALVGRTDGTAFVDITDPVRPRYLGDLPMTRGANASAWRDIKTYHNYAFIVSDAAGPHGMQVFDLTRLRKVTKTPTMFTEDAIYDKINSAHNIVIDTATGFAYAVGSSGGGETCGGGLHMIDIHDPLHPAFAGCYANKRTGRGNTGYTHDAQCTVYHGADTRFDNHEICIGSNETAIDIADVTDKQHPVSLATATYPDVGYTHQAWLTEDQHYLYLDDELDEMNGKGLAAQGTRTLIWDLSKLDDPVLIKQYLGVSKSIDHNLYVKGNRVYQANYTSGLRILDITDPTNPHEVGFFDTYPDGDPVEFDGAWSNYPYFKSGTILVTSIGQGMFLVKDHSTNVVP